MKTFFGLVVLLLIFIGGLNARSIAYKMDNPPGNYTDSPSDSLGVLQAFRQLQHNPAFLKDIALSPAQAQKVQFYLPEIGAVVLGDLNNDRQIDALVLFSVEGRGDGNSWDVHTAVLLKKSNSWHYTTQIDCGGNAADNTLIFSRIENGEIYGKLFPSGTDDPLLSKDVIYKLEASNLLLVEQKYLQKSLLNSDRPWITIAGLQTTNGHDLPLKSTLRKVRDLLGSEDSSRKSMLECGQYFDTDDVRQFFFKGCLTFEVNAKNEAVMTEFTVAGRPFGLKSNIGTIDAAMTRKDFEQIFTGQYFSLDETDSANGNQNPFLRIPAGPNSDNCWDIYFDTSGKIKKVAFFIPC